MTEEFSEIDDIMRALYEAVSGPPGGQDWALERRICHPDARLVRTRVAEDGTPLAWSYDVEGFIEATIPLLEGRAFYEIETNRKVFRFGNVAQVFSAYEAREGGAEGELLFRGMNLVHLFRDGSRWWIMHVIWDNEREGVDLPGEEWFAETHD